MWQFRGTRRLASAFWEPVNLATQLQMRLTQQRGAKMLKSTMEVDIEETPSGWVARYLVSEDREKAKPQRQLFASKADAVAWLSAEATAHGFVYEPSV